MSQAIIVALDVSEKEALQRIIKPLKPYQPFIKIGMELFYREGPQLVETLKEDGYRIFLDLKLHDIPNTVKRAMANLAGLGVDIANVHAAGGKQMMAHAIEGLEAGTRVGGNRPLCLAVTQLTSTDQTMLNDELGINAPLESVIQSYSRLAKESDLDGVVCSPHEAGQIKQELGKSFLTVTPGIRMKTDDSHDQKRIATPGEAKQLGSDYIVVGRSITGSKDIANAYQRVLKEWSDA